MSDHSTRYRRSRYTAAGGLRLHWGAADLRGQRTGQSLTLGSCRSARTTYRSVSPSCLISPVLVTRAGARTIHMRTYNSKRSDCRPIRMTGSHAMNAPVVLWRVGHRDKASAEVRIIFLFLMGSKIPDRTTSVKAIDPPWPIHTSC